MHIIIVIALFIPIATPYKLCSLSQNPVYFRHTIIFGIVMTTADCRPAQIFLGFPPQTLRWSLGQNLPGDQFSANSEVVWPRHGGSEGPQVEVVWALPGDLRASVTWSYNFVIGWKLVSRQVLNKLHRGVWGGNPKKIWAGLLIIQR